MEVRTSSTYIVSKRFEACVIDHAVVLFRTNSHQEWEEEDNQELVTSINNIMRRVTSHCQVEDANFWPQGLSSVTGIAHSVTPASSPDFSDLEIVRSDGAPLAAEAPRLSTFHLNTQTETDAPQSSESQQYALSTTLDSQPMQSSPNPKPNPNPPLSVVYVSMGDVCDHLLQTVQFASSAVIAHSGQTRLVQAALQHQNRLASDISACVDSAREWCRGAVPWPQCVLARRSALRCRLYWEGMTFPIKVSLSGTHGQETDLSNL